MEQKESFTLWNDLQNFSKTRWNSLRINNFLKNDD